MYRVLSMHVRCLRCGKHNVRIGRNDLTAAVSLHDASFSTISSLEHRAAFSNRSGEAQLQLATARTADAFTTVTSLRWRAQSRLSSVPLQSSWVSFFHTSIASLNPRQRKLDEMVPPPLPEDHILQPSKVTLGTANAKDGLTIDASSGSPHTAAPSPSVSGAALTAETPGPEKRDLDGGSTSLSASSFLAGDGDSFEKTDCNAGPVSHSPLSVALTTDAWSSEKPDMPDSSLVEPSDFEDLLVVQKPASSLPEVSSSLTPYVSKSVTLANLVILGVDLSQVEKAPEAAEYLLKSDFDSEVKPYILFLHDLGISRDKLGKVITKNPLLFREHLDDLQVRVNYLEAKRFSPEAIAKVVTGAPLVLLMSVEKVDSKLGFLQSQFKLQGPQVREVVTKLPKLIVWHRQKLKDNRFYLKEFLGFSESELTKILLTSPKVFISDKYAVGKKFDFLHNVVGINHEEMTRWPHIFRTRLHLLQQRHRFLVNLGRAQYDAGQPNYVSLQALSSGTDSEFCTSVAKTSVTQFNNFLRTL